MIHKKSYTSEWIDAKLKEIGTNNYDLAEKLIYAFTLLEQLQLKGLKFIFKGGTSLVLMTEEFHRFSKDIDIVMSEEPANLMDIFKTIVDDTEFIRCEESIRQNDEFQVPKKHYKFYYKESKPSKYPEKPILLDIIFVESTYPKTRIAKVAHPLLSTEEPYAEIEIPTIESITGDKLTAFATRTIGIPAGKNKSIEIVKQLFDLNLLFGKIESFPVVAESFERTAVMCLESYKKNLTVKEVYEDIINIAFTMAMMGNYDKELFDEIKKGVSGLTDYLSRNTKFAYPAASLAAAKIAYLASCLMKKKKLEKLDWKKVPSDEFRNKRIEHVQYASLNKPFKAGNPEAWYYWYHTAEILAEEPESNQDDEKLVLEKTEQAPGIIPLILPLNQREAISLAFIVSGRPTLVQNINIAELLRIPVQQALNQTGNSGRPLEHWLVKLDRADLDVSKRVEEFNFQEDAKIFLSLKAGAGG